MRFRKLAPFAVVALIIGSLYTVAQSALTSQVRLTVTATQTGSADLGSPSFPLNFSRFADFTSGTAADQSNVLWTDRRTLSASATENLDLAGSLTDVFGSTVTFAEVSVFALCADDGNTNNVEIGAAASNTFKLSMDDASDIQVVRPGGCFLVWATDGTGYPVTASTGDQLKIANSGGTTGVTYDVVIAGRSS